MPTTRTPIPRSTKYRITPEMVALFRRAREIEAADNHNFWEAEGGRKREWYDISVELHAMLGRKLWQTDVIDADSDTPPDWVDADDWGEAREIRRKLDEGLE